ncbi:hypothetical protein SEA_YAGO84_67 [Gordonia phage Yago84]|nr:hypothetical protein SEA_YAGO84_67 [Gordonia phage Yago84]
MSDEPRRWTAEHPDGGRIDVDGVEWFACDPYPTWYRWERGDALTGQLIVGRPDWPHEAEVRTVLTDEIEQEIGDHIDAELIADALLDSDRLVIDLSHDR